MPQEERDINSDERGSCDTDRREAYHNDEREACHSACCMDAREAYRSEERAVCSIEREGYATDESEAYDVKRRTQERRITQMEGKHVTWFTKGAHPADKWEAHAMF